MLTCFDLSRFWNVECVCIVFEGKNVSSLLHLKYASTSNPVTSFECIYQNLKTINFKEKFMSLLSCAFQSPMQQV